MSASPDILVRMPDEVYLGAIIQTTETGIESKPGLQRLTALQKENVILSTVVWEDKNNYHRVVVGSSEDLAQFFPPEVVASGAEVIRFPFPQRTLTEKDGAVYQRGISEGTLLDFGLNGITGERVLVGQMDTIRPFTQDQI